ncbi:hypothetical protein [Actinomadura sp. GTD37]|uniref:effector-associated constant component EACC1 n=1 Tax=Actinomadura sp. GTD37 TaxID=1778030 RepID=UPI0035BEEEC7
MLEVRIGVDGDDDERVVASLYRWLSRDPDVIDAARTSLRPGEAEPGTMGAAELIQVLIEDAAAVAGIVSAVGAWYASRRSRPSIRIERGERVYVITDPSPEVLRRILDGTAEDEGEQRDDR